MHQITAYGGGEGPAPFQQAVLQSPAFLPSVSKESEEETFEDFLSLLGVQSIAEARRLPSSTLQKANTAQVFNAPYGLFVYGPTVDDCFVPDLPGVLLLEGRFSNDLKIMLGHNAEEVSRKTLMGDTSESLGLTRMLGSSFHVTFHTERYSFPSGPNNESANIETASSHPWLHH